MGKTYNVLEEEYHEMLMKQAVLNVEMLEQMKKILLIQERNAISAILSDYVYHYSNQSKRLKIGEVSPYYLDNSTDGINIWKTKEDRPGYMVVLRGTSTIVDTQTWPQIILSQETNLYLPHFNHFNDINGYVKDYFDDEGVKDNYQDVIFTGHSLGGTASRVAKQNFPGSSAILHDPGTGLLADQNIQKILRSFLKANIGMVVKSANNYMSPILGEPIANGLSLLGYQWMNHQITSYTKFNMENVSIHRTENDIVSQMGSRLPNVTTYKNPGVKYNFLDNHKMDYLAEQVKELYGMEHLKIEEIPNELVEDTIKDINKFAFNHWVLDIRSPHNTRQVLGKESIYNQTNLIISSRNSYRKDLNQFNFIR